MNGSERVITVSADHDLLTQVCNNYLGRRSQLGILGRPDRIEVILQNPHTIVTQDSQTWPSSGSVTCPELRSLSNWAAELAYVFENHMAKLIFFPFTTYFELRIITKLNVINYLGVWQNNKLAIGLLSRHQVVLGGGGSRFGFHVPTFIGVIQVYRQ